MSADIFQDLLSHDEVFDQTLARIRSQGYGGLNDEQLRAIISSAEYRGRLDELDDAVIQGHKETCKCKECLEKLKVMPDDDGKEVESLGRQVESS